MTQNHFVIPVTVLEKVLAGRVPNSQIWALISLVFRLGFPIKLTIYPKFGYSYLMLVPTFKNVTIM